ncbi:MAG: glycoside hydrolase family 38 C-terminal domain-containing protein, partial [Gemmatimonadota bacterium]
GLAFAARARGLAGGAGVDLGPLWERTLFNQFHDILPGSCAPAAADMARAELGGVEGAWRDAAYGALKEVAAARPVRAAEGEFRIFNTLDRPVRVPLRIESFMYFRPGAAFRDEDGRELAIQEVLPSVRCANRRWEFVDALPARGCRSYWFDSGTMGEAGAAGDPHYRAGDALVTPALRLDADGLRDGAGQVLLQAPRLLVLADPSDTWGHGVRAYDDVIDTFRLDRAAAAGGPVVERLYQRWSYGRSTVEIEWAAYAGLEAIYADVTVNWAEDRRILKWELTPGGCGAAQYTMQGPGGAIRRTRNGEEMPLHHWVQLAGSERAFELLQDGAFAGDCRDQRLRVNLVRSSLYGFHDPVKLVPEDPQHLTDQGLHRFRFALRFGAPRSAAELERAAEEFIEPYWVIREGPGERRSG